MKTVLTRSARVALLVAVASTACDSFLTGPGLTEDPNAPTQASRDQLFVSFQAAQFTQFEGALSRTACIFVQQCAGTDRQYLSLGEYNFTEDDFRSEEHTSELQSHVTLVCRLLLEKKNTTSLRP